LVAAGWLARVLVGWRAAGDELGFQAVEDGLEAELEGVVGCRAVVGGGRSEAGAQPWELRRDLAGFRHAVAYPFLGVTAVAAELPGERSHRGWAEGDAEHEGEDDGRCLVGQRARASYSQAGYNLAGRVVEKVTGLTYERAVASLVLEPLGLSHSFFARDDVMTRRFAVGHNRGEDGTLSIARLWRRWRGENPGGGLASSVADQLRWARFHLGDGRAERGARVLPAEVLHRMKQPTVALRGSNLGDAIGIGWFLRDVNGVRTVGHGGSANGQFAELLTVPERGFAVVSLSNAGPDGIPCNQAVVRWALQAYLGVTDRDPEPLPFDEARAREVVGAYENEVMTATIGTDGAGLRLEVLMKPEIRAAADKSCPRTTRRPISACCPATRTSTSSPAAVSRGCAASSPATRTARSWGSTSPAGCTAGFRRPPSNAR
jgi:hypothetical protein